jgi:hypothetical protein
MDLNRERRGFFFFFLWLSRKLHQESTRSIRMRQHNPTEGDRSESRLGDEAQRREPKIDAFFCCAFSLRLAH